MTREGAWEQWVLFILNGVESTAVWTLNLVEKTDELRGKLEREIQSVNPKLHAETLAGVVFAQPYARIDNVVARAKVSRQAASRWLNELADAGLLRREKIGRNVIFVNDALLRHLFTTPLAG